jgi:hypothetical protein
VQNVQSTAPATASFRGQPDDWFVVDTAAIERIGDKGKIQKHATLSIASSLAIQAGAVFISNLLCKSIECS